MFQNREDAGRKLAQKLISYRKDNPIVIAIPRGGLPVGVKISEKLHRPLGIIIARKIGAPNQKEFGIGAISENNIVLLDSDTINKLGIPSHVVEQIIKQEKKELERRKKLYAKEKISIKDKTVIIVDDGIATGVTTKAAILSVTYEKPKKIILAVPVCSEESLKEVSKLVDRVVCLKISSSFGSVGEFYEDFHQLTDRDVLSYLKQVEK